jgi:hypothetical protein
MPHTKNHGIFRRKADEDRMQIVSLQEMSRRWHDRFKLVAPFFLFVKINSLENAQNLEKSYAQHPLAETCYCIPMRKLQPFRRLRLLDLFRPNGKI